MPGKKHTTTVKKKEGAGVLLSHHTPNHQKSSEIIGKILKITISLKFLAHAHGEDVLLYSHLLAPHYEFNSNNNTNDRVTNSTTIFI